jgi:hypothetical protein
MLLGQITPPLCHQRQKNGALKTPHTFIQEADFKAPYNKTIKKVDSDV